MTDGGTLYCVCFVSCPAPRRKGNSWPQQAMLEMNVHFSSLCSKSVPVTSHARAHTRSHAHAVRTERPLLLPQTQQALAICITEYIHSFTPMMFSYTPLFIFTRRSNGFYEYEDCFFSKKNLETLTVNFCTFLFIFFKLRYVSVKKTENKNDRKKNCLCSCCKWCLLMSSGAVVDSVCSLDQTVLQGANLGDWSRLNKDFLGSCLLATVAVSSVA